MAVERKKGLLAQIKEILGIGPEGGLPKKPWEVESGMEGAFTGADVHQVIKDHPLLQGGTLIEADTGARVKLGKGVVIRSYAEGGRDTAPGGGIVYEAVEASLIGGQVKKGKIVGGLGFTGHSLASVGTKPKPEEE